MTSILGLTLTAGFAAVTVPASAAPRQTYYETEVRFADGSSLLTRLDTGAETATASSNGQPGAATSAAEDNSVVSRDPNAVTTMTSTPDGFHLYGTNTTAHGYIYNSDVLATLLHRISGGTNTTIGQVNVGFKEYLNGGSSIRWQITPKATFRYGPPYSFAYEYWCGVNKPNANDVTCATDDSTADPYADDTIVSETVGNESYTLYKAFGSGYGSNAKFPMLALHVKWPGYPVEVIERFRGWDIRKYSGVWQMSPVSGTGG